MTKVKVKDTAMFIDWLRDATDLAMRKMEIEQKRDPCCIWAEFETLTLGLDDFFKQVGNRKIKIELI